MDRFCVGIDVSSKTLDVAWRTPSGGEETKVFDNTKAGHRALVKALKKQRAVVRVVLESTGIYGLEIAVTLDRAGFEVMVANPRATANFAKAMLQRSKTDKSDAVMLLAFAERMEFVRWTAPSRPRIELRAIGRRVQALLEQVRAEKNRLHAADYVEGVDVIRRSIDKTLRHLEKEIAWLRAEARKLIRSEAILERRFELLLTIKGVGVISAIAILAELAVLPDDMTDRQWVAHAGLDPRLFESGTSVHAVPRISKRGNHYLRAVLYLPARTAGIFDPAAAAFSDRLRRHGKKPLQIHVALMRKLLHGIHAMFAFDQPYDGGRLFPAAGAVGTSGIAPFAISEVSIALPS